MISVVSGHCSNWILFTSASDPARKQRSGVAWRDPLAAGLRLTTFVNARVEPPVHLPDVFL